MPRFHVASFAASTIRLDGQEAIHAVRARRLSVGEKVALFDGRGSEAVAYIISASRSDVMLAVEQICELPRPWPALTLATALPKGPRQDTLIEKCTELGVAAVVPLLTERSVSTASDHKLDGWRRTAIEAAKQSGQAWLPEFHAPESLALAVRRIADHRQALVAATNEYDVDPPWPGSGVPGWPANGEDRVIAFVGPEGGWSASELELLTTAGCQRISLGPNTLRIETAAIALAALAHLMQRTTRASRPWPAAAND